MSAPSTVQASSAGATVFSEMRKVDQTQRAAAFSELTAQELAVLSLVPSQGIRGYAPGGPIEAVFVVNADAYTLDVNSVWDTTDMPYIVRGPWNTYPTM